MKWVLGSECGPPQPQARNLPPDIARSKAKHRVRRLDAPVWPDQTKHDWEARHAVHQHAAGQRAPFTAHLSHRTRRGAGNRDRPQRPSYGPAGTNGTTEPATAHRHRKGRIDRTGRSRHPQRRGGAVVPRSGCRALSLLLDTQASLFGQLRTVQNDRTRLRELILSPEAAVWAGAFNVWEISIKYALGNGAACRCQAIRP